MLTETGRRAGWAGRGSFGTSLGILAAGALLFILACDKPSEETTTIVPPPGRLALDAESREVAKKIQANMRDFLITNKVPAAAEVSLRWVKKAPAEGLYEANFAIKLGETDGSKSYYFDRNAEHFIMGPIYTVGEIFRSRVDVDNMILFNRAAKGPEDAPITIVEYSDFQCPYCGVASPTIKKILKKYDGKIRFVFKHRPMSEIHDWAYDAAIASECARAQKPDTFWYFHDFFYDPSYKLTRDNFDAKTDAFAEKVFLDVDQFKECMKNETPKPLIAQDLEEVAGYGMTSTPTFVINGVVVVGNQPTSVFEEIIQEELLKREAKK